MSKPFVDPLADLVRVCPDSSATAHREEEKREEETTPPTPRSGGSSERARSGSKRQRDLAALAAERNAPPEGITPTDVDLASAIASLPLPASTKHTWLEPLEVLGELDGAVCLAAERMVADWSRRRYAGILSAALGREVRIFDRSES